MRKLFAVFLVLILFFTGCAPRAPDNSGCTYAGNEESNMFWSVNGARTMPAPRWTYHEKKIFALFYYGYKFGNLNVCNGIIYSGGDRLTAVDLNTGKELWETQVKNSLPDEDAITYVLYPTVYKDKIVAIGARLVVEKGFGCYLERRNVLVFDRKTGKLLWKSADIGSKMDYFDWNFPVVLNNRVYVPALNGEYRALRPGSSPMANKKEQRGIYVWDLNSGKLINKILIPFKVGVMSMEGTMIRTDGRYIYLEADLERSIDEMVESSDIPDYLIKLDPRSGKVIWKVKLNFDFMFNSFAVNNRVVAVFSATESPKTHIPHPYIKVFDKKTGKLLWSKGMTETRDICLTDSKLIIQITDDTVACFNPLTGDEIWKYNCKMPKNDLCDVTPFLTKNVLYLDNFYDIIALDPDTGKELWRKAPFYKLNYKIEVDRDMIFIPVNNGFVVEYTDATPSGAMLFPPVIQLWSSGRNNSQ